MTLRTWVFIAAYTGPVAWAESWPPLNPPEPMPVEWVTKHVMNRYPEVHAKHRLYSASLERAEIVAADSWRRRVADQAAEIVRLHAVEHHLDLERQARHAFYEYWQAERAHALVTEQKRLWESYLPAGKARLHTSMDNARDFSIEIARLHTVLLRLEQERTAAVWRLNALLDRRHDAVLTTPKVLELTPMLEDREQLIEQTLVNSAAMRKVNAEVRRAEAVVAGLREKPSAGESLPAATHELAGWQESRRATGTEVIREVVTLHDAARARRDAMGLYQQTLLPRMDQQFKALIAGYSGGRVDLVRLLETYETRLAAELDVLRLRVEYEKSVADLRRAQGRLPPEIERKMSIRPLTSAESRGAQ